MATIRADGLYVSCSWCHEVQRLDARKQYCGNCGHRADVARVDCDCASCAALRAAAADDPRRV